MHAKDFKKYGCCVVVILSHGHRNESIYAADGQFNLQTMLVDRVAMNETLRGKAKIFIVAACKGAAEVDHKPRMQTDDARPEPSAPLASALPDEDDTASDAQTNNELFRLPYMRDTLKCYSTYEGFVSYRDPDKGTVFVQELCRLLELHGRDMHIEDLLKQVNVALTERPKYQQVPSVTSTMSFNFYFGDLKR